MIQAIIIDDEQHSINELKRLLKLHCSELIEVTDTYTSVKNGISGIQKEQPDLVFLDIALKGGTGFDLLRQLDKIDFSIIFVTAYDKYAIEAFEFSAIGYLLKPLEAEKLIKAVDNLSKKIATEDMAKRLDTLLLNLKDMGQIKRMCVPVVAGYTFIETNDIIRCESEGNSTTLFLKDKSKITATKTLKAFETLLQNNGFFRVHHSDLVNLSYVKSYHKGNSPTLRLQDNTEITVSGRRRAALLEVLKNYLKF